MLANRSHTVHAVLLLLLALLALPASGAATMAEVEAALARGDYSRAMPLLESLAAQGNPVAQFKLGSLHSLGQGMPVGVPRDESRAMELFERAAKIAEQQEIEDEDCD
jgi:TPR repeat protein